MITLGFHYTYIDYIGPLRKKRKLFSTVNINTLSILVNASNMNSNNLSLAI